MKILTLTLATLLSCATAFAHNINFTMVTDPVAIYSDLTLNPGQESERKIQAPWTTAMLTIENKSNHDISLNGMHVNCISNFLSYSRTIDMNTKVKMGATVQTQEYIDALPEPNEPNKDNYECVIALRWSGPYHAHLEAFKLKTQ